jgi:hypothetical protein
MKIKSEFVPYGPSVRIKALGYDEPCFAFYQVEKFEDSPCGVDDRDEYIRTGFATCKNSEIPEHYVAAPTWCSAFKWFRINYDLIGFVERIFSDEFGYTITEGDKEPINGFSFDSFESAELHCLDKLINIVETLKKNNSL